MREIIIHNLSISSMSPLKKSLLFLLFIILMFASYANIINVGPSGDYLTIQEAVNAAQNSDEIIVSPGTYLENVNIGGKNIILRSTAPTNQTIVQNTIIDGNHTNSVVIFSGTENETCILSGFTIRNGRASSGGGIYGNGTLATIQYNIITSNEALGATASGGGMAQCNGLIQNNIISNNSSIYRGGGISECQGIVQDNDVFNNSAEYAGGGIAWCDNMVQNNRVHDNFAQGYGGGLYGCWGTVQNNIIYNNITEGQGGGLHGCAEIVQNNIIINNSAIYGGGMSSCGGYNHTGINRNNTVYGNSATFIGGGLYSCYGDITNNILWSNTSSSDPQVGSGDIPTFSCIQDWTGGGTGNITLDPQFVDTSGSNFHLQITSPCIDAGSNALGLSIDFEGDSRPTDGVTEPRGDGSDYDIGADEFVESSTKANNWWLWY